MTDGENHNGKVGKTMDLVVFGLWLETMRPFTDEQVEKLLDRIGVAMANDVVESLEKFGHLVYRLLGDEGIVKLLGVHHDSFYQSLSNAIVDRQLELFLAADQRIESWVGLSGIKAVSLNTGSLWTGTLYRGPSDKEDLFQSYVLDTGDFYVDFDTLLVADAVETPMGMRVILFDSRGVGVPQPRKKGE